MMVLYLAGENEIGAKTEYNDMKVLFNKNTTPSNNGSEEKE
ncbi:hypothetical protein [uncultured Aquimarina sp.]|nr:hypothetical protein [uncultured Aquimarina sp.]